MTSSENEDSSAAAPRSDPGADGAPDPRRESGRGPEDAAASARRAELPADVDAAFAAIVADWAAADAPRWPTDPTAADGDARSSEGPSSGVGIAPPPSGDGAAGDPTSGPATPRPSSAGPTPPAHREHPAREEAEEHFVPPEPPPLPRLGLGAVVGLILLVGGVVLLAVPSLLGGSIGLGIVPGLLSMTAGLGWLVFGLRRPRERDDGDAPDDGAVL